MSYTPAAKKASGLAPRKKRKKGQRVSGSEGEREKLLALKTEARGEKKNGAEREKGQRMKNKKKRTRGERERA